MNIAVTVRQASTEDIPNRIRTYKISRERKKIKYFSAAFLWYSKSYIILFFFLVVIQFVCFLFLFSCVKWNCAKYFCGAITIIYCDSGSVFSADVFSVVFFFLLHPFESTEYNLLLRGNNDSQLKNDILLLFVVQFVCKFSVCAVAVGKLQLISIFQYSDIQKKIPRKFVAYLIPTVCLLSIFKIKQFHHNIIFGSKTLIKKNIR